MHPTLWYREHASTRSEDSWPDLGLFKFSGVRGTVRNFMRSSMTSAWALQDSAIDGTRSEESRPAGSTTAGRDRASAEPNPLLP